MNSATKRDIKKNTFYLLLPIFVGALIGISMLYYFLLEKGANIKFEELALGKENTVSRATVNGISIHCDDLRDASKCIDGYRSLHLNKDIALWLGNSQVHTINQRQSGDETAALAIHHYMESNSMYFITFSQPNANFQEHYLLFEYLVNQLPVTTLVLSVVFDDMRETGIRSTLLEAFKKSSVITRLKRTPIGRSLIANQGDFDLAGNDMAALEDTIQEQSEEYLNKKLSSVWRVWANRVMLRGNVMNSLYQFRNWLFGINPSSIRKMIPGRYIKNIQAMEAILVSASEQGVTVLLYIAPLREDVQIPYDLKQYDRFKKEIQSIAERHGVRFSNLEHLVPGEYWGTKDSTTVGGGQELDFMHFQARGHRLLADALYGELKALWNEAGKQ